ncbi:MAG: PLDc N-terminal domain-containing protein [Phycisphaerales bacterium]|nr:PLDc N-terminal domain-containing protein [Phycisphaerales bacterium]
MLTLALSTGYGLVGLIVFILDIIAIVDVLRGSKPAVNKLLWILLILLLPMLGMVLYFLLGR